MKRYLRANKYINQSNILFYDKIVIDIEIELNDVISASSKIVRFPGLDQFRQDAIDILESFGFEVITDVYDGKMQKGHFSNRPDSISLYFDTYYDLHNAKDHIHISDTSKLEIPEKGKVYCFIHIRISDHTLNDMGDVAHMNYLNENAKKYLKANPKATHFIEEAEIELDETNLYFAYDAALQDLEDDLEFKLLTWLRRANRIARR